jgi:hypothetical protein
MSGSDDFTPDELQALEELADLSESDPALLESIIREGFAEAEQQEQGEALLGLLQNATEHRQEQDRELLERLGQARLGDDAA